MEGIRQWEASVGRPIAALDVSPEGDAVLTGDRAGYVTSFGSSGGIVWQTRLPGPVRSVAIASHGQAAVAGAEDGIVRFFSARGILKWQAKTGGVPSCVNVSEDGATVVVGTSGCTLIRYDQGGNPLWKYGRGAKKWYKELFRKLFARRRGAVESYPMVHPVSSTDISWDASFIAATTADGSTFFFDTWGTCHWQHMFKWKYTHVSISDDGCNVVAGTKSKGIVRFSNQINMNHSPYARVREIIPFMEWAVEIDRDITSVSLSNSGEFIAVGSSENELLLLGQQAETLWSTRMDAPIMEVGISGQGDYIAAVTSTGRVCLYRVVSGRTSAEMFIQFADTEDLPEPSSSPGEVAPVGSGLEFLAGAGSAVGTNDKSGSQFFDAPAPGGTTQPMSGELDFLDEAPPAKNDIIGDNGPGLVNGESTTSGTEEIRELWRRRVADILLPFSRAGLLLSSDGTRLAACASSEKVVFFEGDGTVAGEFTSGESGLVGLCGPHDLGLIFTATKDRVFCLSPDGGIIWQQSLAVSSLSCGSGGDFVAVARPGGSFTILSGSGKMVYEGKVSGDILVSHVSDREMMVAFGTSREIICLTLGGFREDRFATSGSPTFVSCLAGGDVVWAVPDGVFKWRPESPDPQRLLRLSTPACCGAAAGNLVAIGTSGRDFFLLSPGQAALKVPVKSVPTAAAVSADGQWAAVGTRYRVCTLVPFERQRKPSYIKIKGRMEAVALDRTAGRAAFLVGSEVILCATGLISGAMGSADPGKCDIDGTSRLFEGELEFL